MNNFLYVLKLSKNKYYVGHTDDLTNCFRDHNSGIHCLWTKKYKPIEYLEIIHKGDIWDLNILELKIFFKYGLENVRSFNYNSILLTEFEKSDLKNKIQKFQKIYFPGTLPKLPEDYADLELVEEPYLSPEISKEWKEVSNFLKRSCFHCGKWNCYKGITCLKYTSNDINSETYNQLKLLKK